MAFTIVSQGTFIQPATAVNQIIPLPSGVDYFKTWNLSQIVVEKQQPTLVLLMMVFVTIKIVPTFWTYLHLASKVQVVLLT